MDPEELEDQPLTEAELADSPLMEAGGGEVVVPSKGKLFADDGSMKVAIIRPCVSRGRRLKGLPPIYEASMLARCASIYADWPMYMDHLYEAEELIEALKKFHRPITDLGGRLLESWFDPEFRASHDDEKGYRPGGVVGRCIPQPAIRAMLEADPGILNTSINAFPTGARPGVASWNPSLRGMIIEGIAAKPRGSVDWVFRGGAGGHPIAEADMELAVSVMEALYDPRRNGDHEVTDFKNMDLGGLKAFLQDKNPALAEALDAAASGGSGGGTPVPTGGLTLAEVQEALDRQKTELETSFDEKLSERETEVEAEVDRRLSERETLRVRETTAHRLIESSTLPPSWKADLKGAYTLLPSGPTRGLLVEAEDGKDADTVLKERVEEDVKCSLDRLAEAQGRKPRVTGLGSGGDGEGTQTEQLSEESEYLEESLSEMGILETGDDGKVKIDSLLESLEA